MYGFHKTKYKNSEQCFAHKYFRRDDKFLLIKMKRKSKEKPSDIKTEIEDQPPKHKNDELVTIIQDLQEKVKEQDEKIKQLFNANKEFKTA